MNLKTGISIEVIKLKRTGNYVILGVLLVLLFLMASLMFRISSGGEANADYKLFFTSAASQGLSVVRFLFTLFMMINIGKEFTERTLRKNIIDGVSRDEFFIGKVLLLFLAALFAFILLEIVFLAEGFLAGHGPDVFAIVEPIFLLTSFFKILFAGIFGFFLIWLTQSLAASIVIYFAWGIVESIVIKLQQVFHSINVGLEDYLPLSSMEKLFSENVQVQPYAFIVPMVYIFLMFFVPYYLLLKKDIR